MPNTAAAFAAHAPDKPLEAWTLERRDPGPTDVAFEILFCGVCHSDLHMARAEWPGVNFPIVPGHEIVGRVTAVGSDVTNFKPGDLAAVGCMVDSCRTCQHCAHGLEQFCEQGAIFTYNSPDKHAPKGTMTYGGYSKHITVDQAFVLRVPESLDLAATAPLLCAGITTYSPLKHWKTDEKRADGSPKKVGIVGLGGLGHMGLKFAHAFGCETVLFTTSPSKVEDAKRLGADHVVISKDASEMAKHAGSFDFILNTVAASHNLDAYTALLRVDATLCLVGVPDQAHPSPAVINLVFGRKAIAGSLIGGIPETQEMLDFCAKHNITSDIELINIHQIDDAYERMLKSDVKYRFVIDMASL